MNILKLSIFAAFILSFTVQASLRNKIMLQRKSYCTTSKEYPLCSDQHQKLTDKYEFLDQLMKCMSRVATRNKNSNENDQFAICDKKYHDRFEQLDSNIEQELNSLNFPILSLVTTFKSQLKEKKLQKERNKIQNQKCALNDIRQVNNNIHK